MSLYPTGNPAPSSASNPFSSIITAAMKQTFVDAIDALLADDGLTIPCEFYFGGQRFVECTNCSNGVYRPGGPIVFARGKICPLCMGRTHINVETHETNRMVCIFDSRKWMILGKSMSIPASNTANTGNLFAETMTRVEMYPKIKAAQYVILNSANADFTQNKYQRLGEPELLGLASMDYIITAWQRIS